MFRAISSHRARLNFIFLMVAFCLVYGVSAVAAVQSRVAGEALIADKPLEPSSYEIYADFLSSNGAYKEAAEVLERGRTKALPSAHLLVALGAAYQTQGMYGRAESATREALVVDKDNVQAHLQMGDLYFKLGWPKSGLESYQQAVLLAPADPAPKVRLVTGYLEASQPALAEDTCLRFISENQEQPDLWLCLGQVFEKQDKQRQAFTTYGQVLTLDPNNGEAYARQGRLFCEFGQFTSAEASCLRALDLDPDNSLAHAYLGIAYSYLGNNEGAREHAQIAESAGLNMLSVWKKVGQ